MIIFMGIGGDVQDHAVNGNLFMVMLNDQWIEHQLVKTDGGVSDILSLVFSFEIIIIFYLFEMNMNDVVVASLRKLKNLKIIKLKEIKKEVRMKLHQIKIINHQLVRVNISSNIE
jgi:hypothetical protein